MNIRFDIRDVLNNGFAHYQPTDSNIEDTGATSLSEALKSNTTLTKLNLSCEERRHTKDIHQQFTISFHTKTTALKKEEQHH